MKHSYIIAANYVSVMNLETGAVTVINRNDSRWDKAMEMIRNGHIDEIEQLNIKESVKKFMKFDQTSSSGQVRLRLNNDVIEYSYNMDSQWKELHNAFATRVVEMAREGIDPSPMMSFLAKLLNNPSKSIIEELPLFLENNQLPITPNGNFVAYKIVRSDYSSVHDSSFMNNIGTTVEMPRQEVNDNRNETCSTGLHFCNRNYLNSYGSSNRDTDRLLLLVINPQDVVSIPNDYNNAKGRACKYVIWKDITTDEWRQLMKNSDFTSSPVVDVENEYDGAENVCAQEVEEDPATDYNRPMKDTILLTPGGRYGPYKYGYACGVEDFRWNNMTPISTKDDTKKSWQTPGVSNETMQRETNRFIEGYDDGWAAASQKQYHPESINLKYAFSE